MLLYMHMVFHIRMLYHELQIMEEIGSSERVNETPQTQMERVEMVLAGLVQVAEHRLEEQRAPRNVEPRVETTTIAKFYKQRPIDFHGNDDAMKADFWIMDMERIFRVLPCTDEQKILFATDTLRDEAQYWWSAQVQAGMPSKWEEFLKIFRKQYFPPSLYEQKTQELLHLQQGN